MTTAPADNGKAEEERGAALGVWRFAMASRAHVVVDAAAYFSVMQQAMLAARQRILLIGWDFDTRVKLGPGRRWWNKPDRQVQPARLGAFVIWLANRTPGLAVRVLKWKFGAFKFVFRGSMALDLLRWWRHPAIDFKFDSAHPLGCSHHQKIVVIDDKFAVCGGIDMTTDRWDTPLHIENDPRRMKPNRKLYGPWHDLTMLVEGDAARTLGDLGRARWKIAGGAAIDPCKAQQETAWPQGLRAEFENVEVGISRTVAAYAGQQAVHEIEELFVQHIARARRFIYAESQYFASRAVAEALAERLSRPDPPEVLLINPLNADGWLEQTAMDGARVRLLHAVGERDLQDRLKVFCPFTSGSTPIYVHAKVMIVDDEIVRIGSANMNNRSMGLDTEADLFIDAARPANDRNSVRDAIQRLRYRLLGEHCGIDWKKVPDLLAAHGTMAAMIESLPRNGKRLEPFNLRPLTETEKALADSALLDPERPEELFEPMSRRRGLFRLGSLLRRPN